MDLSVIVITKNEEVGIRGCLDSCFQSIECARKEGLITSAEVILSDSASTDRTVEFARAFPVTIVQLWPEWQLSAAAGRHVGLRHARGESVLFVDGDYVLDTTWLPEAIRVLRSSPRVAAVCGRDVERFTGDSVLMRVGKKTIDGIAGEPPAIPVGLYRRSSIDAIGGIHPFLRGAEDRDLAHRLRSSGYRLVRVDRTMGVHQWADAGPLDYMTYFRSVLIWSIGDGQVFRLRRRERAIAADIRRRYANVRHIENYLLGLGLGGLGLLNLIAIFLMGAWPLALIDAIAVGLLSLVRLRNRWSWKELFFRFHVVPYSSIRHAGFLVGLLHRPSDPSAYPRGERVLQTAPAEGA